MLHTGLHGGEKDLSNMTSHFELGHHDWSVCRIAKSR
jgi:hypothetical protein